MRNGKSVWRIKVIVVSLEQPHTWLLYGNMDGLPAEIIKPERYKTTLNPIVGFNYLNNPNDPVATFIRFNFGQTNHITTHSPPVIYKELQKAMSCSLC